MAEKTTGPLTKMIVILGELRRATTGKSEGFYNLHYSL